MQKTKKRKTNKAFGYLSTHIKACPYCKNPAGWRYGGDEILDYCEHCEKLIEGRTILIKDDEVSNVNKN